MATTERDYYEVLGVARSADEAEIKSAFRRLAREVHPDVSDAPDAKERFAEVAEAYEVLSKRETRELYDRYGHAGLRSGGYSANQFDFGSLADVFSAFFGDDLLGGTRSRRGGDVLAHVEIGLREAATRRAAERPLHRRVHVHALRRRRCRARHAGEQLPDLRRRRPRQPGLAHRLRRVRPLSGVPDLCRQRPRRRDAVQRVPRRRPRRRRAAARRGHSRRASTTGSASACPARATPARSARRRATPTSTSPCCPIRTSCARATTCSRRSRSRSRRRRSARPSRCRRSTARPSSRFEPGTQPGEVRVLRGRGMPVLNGFGRGDQRVLVNVVVPRRLSDEQRTLLEQFDAVGRRRDATTRTKGSSTS